MQVLIINELSSSLRKKMLYSMLSYHFPLYEIYNTLVKIET